MLTAYLVASVSLIFFNVLVCNQLACFAKEAFHSSALLQHTCNFGK